MASGLGLPLISIHSLLAEGDCNHLYLVASAMISIHSLLAEGDLATELVMTANLRISIHSLLAEGDRWRYHPRSCLRYFNPLPPRGGRQGYGLVQWTPY